MHRLRVSVSALFAADVGERSLDDGDGPPCLQVKPCTPEFYQTHYQLVSLGTWQEEESWDVSYLPGRLNLVCVAVCFPWYESEHHCCLNVFGGHLLF